MFNFSQKGVSIYLALMIMTILLAIALGISTILIGQIKMVRGMGDSVIAFCAADTGIEKILYEASKGTDIIIACPSGSPCEEFLNGAKFSVTVLSPGETNCPVSYSYYCIQSVGIYKGVRRAIQADR